MRIKAYRVIQMVILSSVLLCAFMPVKAQIYFKNPSFEGETPGPNKLAPYWHYFNVDCNCGGPVVLMDKSYWRYTFVNLPDAYNGLTYTGVGGGMHNNDTAHDGYYQKLSCTLKKGVNYTFSYYTIGFIQVNTTGIYATGSGINVWLLDDNLNRKQLISHTDSADSFWRKITVNFIPDADYHTILLIHYQPNYKGFNAYADLNSGIDYLSGITFDPKTLIAISATDTVLKEYKAVTLYCTPNEDTSAISYSWSSHPPGFSSIEQNPTANPKQTTTYICTAHYPCGMDATDSVQVHVDVPPTHITIPTYLKAGDYWQIQNDNATVSVKLYTALGQLLYTDTNYQNTYNPTHEGLAPGVYFYVINYNGGNEVRGKVLVVRL